MGKNRGFTLVELVVTIAVIAVVSIMAAPSMANLMEKRRYDQNARELLLALSQAKSQAILNRSDVSVNLASNSVNTLTSLNWNVINNTTLSISPTVTASTFVFNSNGLISNIAGDRTLTLCNAKVKIQKTIVVTRLGTYVIKPEGTC
ncbi:MULTISPECIES: GspH/FimT family pseudopilin [Acinetobacter]|uniref:GspH/FimT family pseudopilin n=1 Tax=Acinetobacter TaxID=469 RepID=UPI000235EFC2|nr:MULTISPECIES: GspH/FimT family pseudopilin [Acinetobacter]KXZ75260.1 hypothetical protein AVENLUH8758_00241 [Acinetobacter venetianus]GAB01287.1 putative fimbrial protein [Acinetobacter sp. NBRC 100985]